MARHARQPEAAPSRRARRRAEKARAKAAGERRSILWRMRRVFFGVALLFVLAVVGAGYLFTQVPLPDEEPPLLQTSFICAADVQTGCNAQNSLAQLSGGVDRTMVTYDQLPPVVIQAVLAAEDRTFYEHQGVDPVGIARALWANVRSDSVQQGGSTITQQYVKNVYLTQERTLVRKVKEAALAVKLERELSKDEILVRYLNTIYFGRGAYGVEAAARTYFGKDVSQLDLPEAAYLAGLIRAPETADAQLAPDDPKFQSNRATAEQRRTSVLDAMLEEQEITQEQYDAAVASGWDMVVPRTVRTDFGNVARPELGTEYYIEYVRHWLVTQGGFTDAEVYGGGLRVYTTLDMGRQEAAVDAITSTLDQPDDPKAALVSIDAQGAVVAMVGGLDYGADKVNLATGTEGGGGGRQPGSSFKPFVLAEAIEQGIPLNKTYNAPSSITIPKADNGSDWKVANYGDAGLGTLDLVQATAKSSNTAYAQLMLEVGPENAVAMAHALGITSDLEAVPSLVLGTNDVSVLEMASAYSTFADDGEHIDPYVVTKVTDAEGNVLYENTITRNRVISEDTAAQVNYTLSQVVDAGTATSARYGQSAAGKTGTTENYRDAWFAGYTCSMTTAVWVGYPDGERYMENVHGRSVAGGTFPAQIWRKYMVPATEGLESCDYPRPPLAPYSGSTPSVSDGSSGGSSGSSTTTAPPSSTSSTPPSSTTTTAPPSTTTTAPPSTTTTTAPPSTTSTTLGGAGAPASVAAPP